MRPQAQTTSGIHVATSWQRLPTMCFPPPRRDGSREVLVQTLRKALRGILSISLLLLPHPGAGEIITSIKQKLNTLFSSPGKTHGHWGCCVTDLTTNQFLYKLNADALLIPASNQKLLTAASALLKLGPSYHSKTLFYVDGPIQNGALQGNLIIVGFGAIYFTARYPSSESMTKKNSLINSQLDGLAKRLKNFGIFEIEGKVLLDPSYWTDMTENYHYPSAAPFSFNENTLDLQVINGSVIHCPEVLSGFTITHQNWRGTQKKITRDGNKTDGIVVNPRRNSTDYWRIDQMSPLTYYRSHIKKALVDRGIMFTQNGIMNHTKNKRKFLFHLASIPLDKLLIDMCIYSDNFRAETVFLNLGYVMAGKANYETAAQSVKEILLEQRLVSDHTQIADGSGLSRSNRISPVDIVKLLRVMNHSTHKPTFIQCLPSAGETGTLKKKLTKSAIKGRVIAKTGSLRDVSALSGYILTRSLKPALAFSFLVNDTINPQITWRTLEAATELLVMFVDGQNTSAP